MEIRARYILMGLFTLGVALMVFAFVFWMHSTGGFRERAEYHIKVENSVSGLLKGAAVLFNGIRVGEVTNLKLDPKTPRQVMVEIAVNRDTPIRADTRVDVDFQGLTGVAFISMNGGSPDSPLPDSNDGPPVLTVNSGNGQTVGQAARDALARLNSILDENAIPVHNTINNLSAFSDVLAKNTEKVENILGGLERMTGGAAPKNNGQPYDLDAPRIVKGVPKALKGMLVVSDPTALIALDTQNVAVRVDGAAPPVLRWGDNLPKLVQARVVQTFENAGFMGSVNKPGDGITGDFQLLMDVRNFQIVMAAQSATVDIEFTAKILDNAGKIVEAHPFRVTVPVASADVEAAMVAMNTAFGNLSGELVTWASNVLADTGQPQAPANP